MSWLLGIILALCAIAGLVILARIMVVFEADGDEALAQAYTSAAMPRIQNRREKFDQRMGRKLRDSAPSFDDIPDEDGGDGDDMELWQDAESPLDSTESAPPPFAGNTPRTLDATKDSNDPDHSDEVPLLISRGAASPLPAPVPNNLPKSLQREPIPFAVEEPDGRFVAVILFDHPVDVLDSVALAERMRALYPDFVERVEDFGESLIGVGPALIAILNLPEAVPAVATQSLVERAYWWPEAASSVATHTTHIALSVMKPSGAAHSELLSDVKRLTWLAGAICDLYDGQAVIWNDVVINSGEIFTRQAADKLPPYSLWVDVRPIRLGEGQDGKQVVSLRTDGLQAFAGREIEVEPGMHDLKFMAQRVSGVIRYLLLNGAVLNDGDSIGANDRERITVKTRMSATRPGVPVLQLTLTIPPAEPATGA